MSDLKKTGLIAVGALVFTLINSWSFSTETVFSHIAGIGVAHAAGPNGGGSNNPGKCNSATNPKCTPASPS